MLGRSAVRLRTQHCRSDTARPAAPADELDLADFVELINGDKEAPTRPVSHDMLVQETLLRYTGEIPEVRTASSASSGFAKF